MEEFELKDIADELLIIPKLTIDKLFLLDNASDCIALYMLYYKTAKWQKTNQPKANDEYVKKCLKWGFERIRKTKQTLKEQGLIDIVQYRKDGKIAGWYVRVSYLITQKQVEDIKIEVQNESNNTSIQEVGFATSSEQNLNTLKENNKYLKKENINTLNNNVEKDNIKLIPLTNINDITVPNKKLDIRDKKESLLLENVKCIIEYLNESINSNYKYTTKGTINLIKARFKEGYKLDDFYDVIDKKVKEWYNTEMQQYLRPSTLFGNKFEGYLNQTYFKGKAKSSYSSKPNFDNTSNHNVPKGVASMTEEERQDFYQNNLAKDKNGNYIKF